MTQKFTRKPIGNFFIKKDLQVRLIMKIVLTVFTSTIVSAITLLGVYWVKYQSILLYQMDAELELSKENIVYILLPTILISSVVNIFIAACVGLYASRKYAVPVFKLEQWVSILREGRLGVKLRFREKEEMRELSDTCNKLAEELRLKLLEIKSLTKSIEKRVPEEKNLIRIEEILDTLDVESEEIEVKTSIIHKPA